MPLWDTSCWLSHHQSGLQGRSFAAHRSPQVENLLQVNAAVRDALTRHLNFWSRRERHDQGIDGCISAGRSSFHRDESTWPVAIGNCCTIFTFLIRIVDHHAIPNCVTGSDFAKIVVALRVLALTVLAEKVVRIRDASLIWTVYHPNCTAMPLPGRLWTFSPRGSRVWALPSSVSPGGLNEKSEAKGCAQTKKRVPQHDLVLTGLDRRLARLRPLRKREGPNRQPRPSIAKSHRKAYDGWITTRSHAHLVGRVLIARMPSARIERDSHLVRLRIGRGGQRRVNAGRLRDGK